MHAQLKIKENVTTQKFICKFTCTENLYDKCNKKRNSLENHHNRKHTRTFDILKRKLHAAGCVCHTNSAMDATFTESLVSVTKLKNASYLWEHNEISVNQ